MPYLTVYTNVEFKNGAALAEEASELTARVLGKPVGYVVANFIYNPNMAFGGSAAAWGALAELKSIGLGGKDAFIGELTAFLAAHLEIAEERNINIALVDSPAAQTACNGKAFG